MIDGTTSEDSWDWLRSGQFHLHAELLINVSREDVVSVKHIRSAHYATYKVDTADGSEWIVRIGMASESDDAPVKNNGYLGTSLTMPTGQEREFEIAKGFSEAGAIVCEPHYYTVIGNYDLMWLPYLKGKSQGITAEQWADSLSSLRAYKPEGEVPVFTNRAKSLHRLQGLEDGILAQELGSEYDRKMKRLFEVASKWSMVHGDAHSGNALDVEGQAVLFDFDTACWAPSVWDFTHLLNRAGTGENTGYTVHELIELSGFHQTEIDAALDLRKTASRIAREANQKASV